MSSQLTWLRTVLRAAVRAVRRVAIVMSAYVDRVSRILKKKPGNCEDMVVAGIAARTGSTPAFAAAT
jgi:hypothetical protein